MEAMEAQLQQLNNEVKDKDTKLEEAEKDLRENPEDQILRARHDRLVQALADLNARRKNLEDKLLGQKLFNNITVFVRGRYGYVKRDYVKLTQTQFLQKMQREGCVRVVPVDEQPSQILAVDDCTDKAVDVDDVQLQDNMRLAVVVGAEDASNWLEQKETTIQGWKEGLGNAADEYQSAEWATAHLAGDEGARRWCFKAIEVLVEGCQVQIEIDGMAYSERRVVLVERKPRIALVHVDSLKFKMQMLEQLVATGAPNTRMLRDPATGLIKPLEVFLMAADGWADNQAEAAACAVRMEECGIAPLLPTGEHGGYCMVHDSCGRWPVDDSTRRRGQQYLPKLGRQPQSGGGAATDADAGSGGGGVAGPNSAVGTGRHTISSQQAACSPAPTHHLRVHYPFSAAGAAVRRRVAPVCRPPHLLHTPRQHHSRMRSVRRL
ncbi:hypothetical protein PLESTM_000315600 [Pleodorina starrii]|nr:hypothetical protein PLESTM_000315600 [Pleodorina starrii]